MTRPASGGDDLTVTVTSTVNRNFDNTGTDGPGWIYDYRMRPSSGNFGRLRFAFDGTKAELEYKCREFNDPKSEHQTHADETQAAYQWNKALKKSCDDTTGFRDGFAVEFLGNDALVHSEQGFILDDESTPLLANER